MNGWLQTQLYRNNQLSAMEIFELMVSILNPKLPRKTPLNKQPMLELKPRKNRQRLWLGVAAL